MSITSSPSALLLCIFLKRHLNWYCLISLCALRTYIKALKVIWHHQFVLGMRGLWNIKALSSNEIVDCRFIHTQGESALRLSFLFRERELIFLFILRERAEIVHTQGEGWDCSYSGRELRLFILRERAEIANLSLLKTEYFNQMMFYLCFGTRAS